MMISYNILRDIQIKMTNEKIMHHKNLEFLGQEIKELLHSVSPPTSNYL